MRSKSSSRKTSSKMSTISRINWSRCKWQLQDLLHSMIHKKLTKESFLSHKIGYKENLEKSAKYQFSKKSLKVANEVRRTIKALKECQESANLYNARERLFDMPLTDYSKIQKLQKDFQPYRK